jgi:hypothetical protein
MKSLLSALVAAAVLSTASIAIAADPTGPAEKADSGSLSSGAKEAAPATKNQGENAPVGNEASSGASAGDSGTETTPGTKKPMSSDPAGTQKK